MSAIVWVIVIVVGLMLVAGAILARHMIETRRRRSLQARFLSEYDRTVRTTGDRRTAERELQERVDRYNNVVRLHDINAARKEAIRSKWIAVQAGFVDDPQLAGS